MASAQEIPSSRKSIFFFLIFPEFVVLNWVGPIQSWERCETVLFGVVSCVRTVVGLYFRSNRLEGTVRNCSIILLMLRCCDVQVGVDICEWFHMIYSLFNFNNTLVRFSAKPPKPCWLAWILNNISNKKEENLQLFFLLLGASCFSS